MTDILDLEGWKAIDRRIEDGEYVVEAEYMTQPDACLKCGVIGRFYKHGTKATPRRMAKATRPPTTMTRSLEWNEGHRTLIEALGSRCESCGGVFEPEFLEAHHVVPLVDGEKPRRLYLCPNCHRRFHTEYGVSHHSNSTD